MITWIWSKWVGGGLGLNGLKFVRRFGIRLKGVEQMIFLLKTSVEQLYLIIKELQRYLEHGGFLSGFLVFFVEQLDLIIKELERNLELRSVYKGSQKAWNNCT